MQNKLLLNAVAEIDFDTYMASVVVEEVAEQVKTALPVVVGGEPRVPAVEPVQGQTVFQVQLHEAKFAVPSEILRLLGSA